MLRRTRNEFSRTLAGYRAQIDRQRYFAGDFDLAGALEASGRIKRLLDPQLPDLRVAVGLPEKPARFARWTSAAASFRPRERRGVPQGVFAFWDRPVEEAPPLVQSCLSQLRKVYPNAHILDGPAVREWIDVPGRVADLLENERPAHFTDYVRTRLLEEHGGMWVDATAWVDRPLDRYLYHYLRGGIVFPRWSKGLIANWFIASYPGTPLIGLLRRGLEAWWDTNDDLPDYFLYHRMFEYLRTHVPEVRGHWDATPKLSAASCYLLELDMMQPYRRPVTRAVLDAAPLQKLSYKYDAVIPGSLLEHLEAGDVD